MPTSSAAPRSAEAVALAIGASGGGVRAHGCLDPWLNPDEGTYFQLALARSWEDFFAGVVANAHPPLQYLILRGLSAISTDFAWLRAPSLIAGSLAVYAMGRLGREAAGWRTGLLAGALLAVSPGSILLSQVMRPYALLLLLLTTSAWMALRHLRTHAPRDLVLHALTLGLAMMTHYSAFVTAPVFGALLLGEAIASRRPLRELALRGAAQGPLLALAFASWWLHLRPYLLGQPLQTEAQRGWLEPFLHDGVRDSWLGFVGVQRYLLGSDLEAVAVLLFTLGGLGLLLARRYPLVVLSSGVLAAAAGAALLDQLPFGSSRHSAYLATFTLPVIAASVGLAWDRGWRHGTAAVAAVSAALVWPGPARTLTGADRLQTRNTIEHVASAESIRAGVAEIESWTRQPRLIVMDRQTFVFLAPYLHRLSAASRHGRGAVLAGFRWGSADVVVSRAWTLRVDDRRALASGHLRNFLTRADQALPRLHITQRSDGALVIGGWHVERYASLVERDRKLAPEGDGAVRDWKLAPGLASAQVDWRRYLALPVSSRR